MRDWHLVEGRLNLLKTFGIFDKILTDREKHIAEMTSGEETYPVGEIFGCEIYFKVKFNFSKGDK